MTRFSSVGLVLASALSFAACGLWPGGDPDASTPSDSVAPAAVEDSTVQPAAGQVASPPVVADSATESVSTDSLTIDERIDLLVRAQADVASKLDSLLAIGPASVGPVTTPGPADSASVAQAPGEVLDEASQRVQSFGVAIFGSVIVIILFNLLIRSFVWVLDRLSERSAKRRLFYKRLVPIVRIVLWAFAGYLIVSVIFKVDYQGIVAAAAAVGVAIGFAAQDLLKNLFGGLILVFDQPFQVGDKISVGGTYGEVVSIGLRSTRMVTPDDNLVSVPNAQVVDQQVANANAGELNCQVVTDVYLPGWVDEAKAKRIAFEAAASSKYVFLNKPIVVLVKDEFKETFLTRVRVKAYVLDPRFEFLFQSEVTERARAGFRESGLLSPQVGMRAFLDLSTPGGAAPPRTGGNRDEG